MVTFRLKKSKAHKRSHKEIDTHGRRGVVRTIMTTKTTDASVHDPNIIEPLI